MSSTSSSFSSSSSSSSTETISRPPRDLDYTEVSRPIQSTRRPQTRPRSPPPPPQPAPDEPAPGYTPVDIRTPNPPNITEDIVPPYYEFDAPPVPPFFKAILNDDETEIARLLAENPELANERDPEDRTPLYRAVIAFDGRIDIVKMLLEAGAEVDAWNTEAPPTKRWGSRLPSVQRTALMAASSRGRLPLVRLLLNHSATTSLVAPDGQHALRLASSAQSREIVAILPSLRAGGWKRMKTRSRPHIAAIKKTAKIMYDVVKFIIYRIPRFFLWTVPKHLGKFSWSVAKDIGSWIRSAGLGTWTQLKKFPGACQRFLHWLPGAMWKGIKGTPDTLKRLTVLLWEGLKAALKWIWRAITVHIPKATVAVAKSLWSAVKWIWRLLTVHIPKFTVAVVTFLWDVIKALAKWVWKVITVRVPALSVSVYHALLDAFAAAWTWCGKAVMALASLIHTFVSFILRQCTLSNLLQGLRVTFNFFFSTIPKAVWAVIKRTYELLYMAVTAVFGGLGACVWCLGECLVGLALWFPTMIGRMLVNFGRILAGAWKEVRLWVDPKANV